MPSAALDLETSKSMADKVANLAKPMAETQKPMTSTSAVPLVLGEVHSFLLALPFPFCCILTLLLSVCQGCDLSSLLTFDPESIEPATSRASEEPGSSTTHGQLQRLKDLFSSSIETLVENPEEVKGILEDIQPHLPVALQVKLWPAVTLSVFQVKGAVGSSEN
jgi:hypothetical protein